MKHALVVHARTRTEQLLVGSLSLPAAVMVTLVGNAPSTPRPLRVVIVLDRSPSMAGLRLRAAVRAAHQLVALLGDGDEVGLVCVDDGTLATPPIALGRVARERLHATLDAITIGEEAALITAIERAAALARTDHAGDSGHVLVISDGVAARLAGASDLVDIMRDVTLSAICIDADATEVEVAPMRHVALAGLLHAGEYDAIDEDLRDHLARLRSRVTGPTEVRVQIDGGFVHAGDMEPRTDPFMLSALTPGETRSVAFSVELVGALPRGTTRVGLVTVRATTFAGVQLVHEEPLVVEAAARMGRLEPEVVRAQCIREAHRAVCLTAERVDPDGNDGALACKLFESVGAMTARAEAAGLTHDDTAIGAISLVRRLADDIARHRLCSDTKWWRSGRRKLLLTNSASDHRHHRRDTAWTYRDAVGSCATTSPPPRRDRLSRHARRSPNRRHEPRRPRLPAREEVRSGTPGSSTPDLPFRPSSSSARHSRLVSRRVDAPGK